MFLVNRVIKSAVKEVIEDALNSANNVLKLHKDVDSLTQEKRQLKDELLDIKKQKELEKTEIEHLVALKEERMKLQISQKEVEMEKQFQKKEIELMQKNHDEALKRIEKAGSDMKEIYAQIMLRLPNVNMNIKETRGK